MGRLRVGFIGTGRKAGVGGPKGRAMAYQHAAGYRALPDLCEMVACADIVRENGEAFAQQWGIPPRHVYESVEAMCAAEELDIVSVALWPHLHAPLVMQAAGAGVRAIFCEKPMADTWANSRAMAEACAEHGVQLCFNHQRRFGRPFRGAKELLDGGVIGDLVRTEFGSGNLYDYGSHNFDLSGYFNGQRPGQWAIAQIDYRTERLVFGMHNENQAYALWLYDNGVFGVASTGEGSALVGCHNRLIGTEGEIEIGRSGPDVPVLRYRRYGSGGWQAVDCGGDDLHGPGYVERAVADVVMAVANGTESELCARNALQATELIFACWESARRRARVDLPLDIADNPLAAMVECGDLHPRPPA
jgi:predicted dehydrogenase